MQEAKRVAKNTGFLYARMAITVFISLYSTRLILAALGVKDFGIFNVVGGAIAMLTFLNNAMSGASQRFMSFAEGEGNYEKQKSIFNVSTVLHLITAILVVLLLEAVGYFLFNGVLVIPSNRIHAAYFVFHFLVISTFFTILSVPYDAVINAHENMFLVAILGVIEAVIKLGIAFYITYSHSDKLIVYGLFMALLTILILCLKQLYCRLKYDEVKINIKKYYDKKLFKEMTSFAGWSFLGSTSSMLSFYGQGLILNMFFGTVVNAAQGVATQVGGQLSSFSGTMLKALNPIIAKSEGSGNRDLMFKATFIGSKVAFFLLMILSIPVIIEMPIIFKYWLKEVPEYTVIFCRLLLIKLLLDQINVNLTTLIAAVGDIKKYQIVVSIVYILPIIVASITFKVGFPPYSIYIIFIIFSFIAGITNIYFSKKVANLPVNQFCKEVILKIVISFLISLSISALPLLIFEEGFIRLFIVFCTSFIISLLIIWVIGLTSVEKLYFGDFYKSIKANFNRGE
ncbi:hypothetical protein [Cellulophaga baltica]|uniref:hypothetical protein n=1 Tax=Cellulophaga baltica TaxID=76594 RepID=UPI0024946335|nr:hypothetical protein [Cellulophaga baltica]